MRRVRPRLRRQTPPSATGEPDRHDRAASQNYALGHPRRAAGFRADVEQRAVQLRVVHRAGVVRGVAQAVGVPAGGGEGDGKEAGFEGMFKNF